ncbi:hypothetical protein DY000_02027082 [Brassica cretica]|uniref:Protein kinase domain-containing protein n=1 Tax=Brassica cretica TaxID=69181 RepID=A0ABQ7EEJ9_BRACR|nr:hypothetical protein DY000_02027082 [Brassica cretica]
MNRGYLTPNSTYDVNRRLILSSLPSNVTAQEGFFFNGSIGQEPNRVYGIGIVVLTRQKRIHGQVIPYSALCATPTLLFRWELYPFFKAFDNISVASPPPPPLAARDHPLLIRPVLSTMELFFGGGENYSTELKMNVGDTDISAAHSSQYDFKTIEAATNKFSSSNKLGEGGFGEVYKGKLSNGTEAAVERFGTRDKRVQERGCSCVKTATQESDFGLSTIFGTEQTRVDTNRIAGTFAYMSPEYAMHGQYSMKSDVYSFGVLVLEIISGKKNNQMDETRTAGNLVTNVLVDPAIGRNYQRNEVTRCIHIALLCVQDKPEDRPLLSTIILMLTSKTITLPKPRLPSLFPAGLGIRWIPIKSIYKKIC